MGKKIGKITATVLWSFLLITLLCAGLYDLILPNEISIGGGEQLPVYPCISFNCEETKEEEFYQVSTLDARLFGVVSLKKIEVKDYQDLSLIPSGRTFGVKMLAEGVCVLGVSEIKSEGKSISPASLAGLAPRDMIVSINDCPVKTVGDLKGMIDRSNGNALTVRYRRGEVESTCTLIPKKDDSDGKYKSGMLVKDSASGIGTVTYINEETGEFGALGHGICDSETGNLLPLSKGIVTDAVVTDVVKGAKGDPGELKGHLKSTKKGVIIQNTDCGVFGALATYEKGGAIPVGISSTVKTGKAILRTMLDGDTPIDYTVEITEIHRKSPNKSFTVRVTDPRLLAKTGGIVQGMSGSPIIQNGKLVGAVTHVMIHDATSGYGIFIENMLNAAQNQVQPNAA